MEVLWVWAIYPNNFSSWAVAAFAAVWENVIEEEKNKKPSFFGALFGNKKEENIEM